MADRAVPEIAEGLADSATPPVRQDAAPPSLPETSTPMLEVHAPHKSIHSWSDFFIHIATIVIGLCIAVGLEQTVEYAHHRHQSESLERQMKGVLENNRNLDTESIANLKQHRLYLADLRAAINARLHGQPEPPAPSNHDIRMAPLARLPNLAPYDAAKLSGLVAVLATQRLRIYSRLANQRDFFSIAVSGWTDDLHRLSAFQERFWILVALWN